MATQPQTGAHAAQIGTETKRALRDFVCTAVSRLPESLKDQTPEWEIESRWKRGPDGHFREHTKRTRQLGPAFRDEWLRSLPDYHRCVEHLKSDVVVGPHLDRLVGIAIGASRLEADRILWSLIYATHNDEETFTFTDAQFERKWRELVDFFGAERIPFTLVAPLP